MAETLRIPPALKSADTPVVHIQPNGANLRDPSPQDIARVATALGEAMDIVARAGVSGQALVKVHIGEEKCVTRMRPEYAGCAAEWLRKRGASGVVAGDTTVAYTGPRGHKENPKGSAAAYMGLAERQGWSESGPAGLPFAVLDRPATARQGVFEFDAEAEDVEIEGVERFSDFWLAGGFAASGFMVNFAHLTLHGLAGVAGCVKSVAMGCAGLRGKLRMHQSLLPRFDAELCAACGQCVDNCPEDALSMGEDPVCPVVEPDQCIGCGECEAVCSSIKGAITLSGHAITDWTRGQDTLPLRMTDYTVGLMNGRWERAAHVLHMYSVTERCDCLNIRQKPMVERDLGFLVGANPFALDRLGGHMLAASLPAETRQAKQHLLGTAGQSARYAEATYGIASGAAVETLAL